MKVKDLYSITISLAKIRLILQADNANKTLCMTRAYVGFLKSATKSKKKVKRNEHYRAEKVCMEEALEIS